MVDRSAEAFKTRDATSYDPVAGEYDALIERYSGALAERMVMLAHVTRGARVLDIGTGTGIVALRAAQDVGDQGHVTGIDLSAGMLARAREKALACDLSERVEFRQMDAERLTLDDASFDAVLSLFALHHFPNPLAALGEMHRVLTPGGKLCIGMGSGPSRFTVAGMVDAVVQVRDLVSRRMGRLLRAPHFMDDLLSREIPAREPDELTALASHGWKETNTVPQLVREAGFTRVRTNWLGQRRVIRDADEFWELQRVYSSTARKRLSTVSADQLATFKRGFLERCRTVQERGGVLVYSYAALYVIAERPLAPGGAA